MSKQKVDAQKAEESGLRLLEALKDLPRLLDEVPLDEQSLRYLYRRLVEVQSALRESMLGSVDRRILQEAKIRDDYRGLMTALMHKLWECDDVTRGKRAARLLNEVNNLMTAKERIEFQGYICRAWDITRE